MPAPPQAASATSSPDRLAISWLDVASTLICAAVVWSWCWASTGAASPRLAIATVAVFCAARRTWGAGQAGLVAGARADPLGAMRSARLDQLLATPSASDLAVAARQLRIRWVVLHPEDSVSWPASITNAPVFTSRGYRLYRLD